MELYLIRHGIAVERGIYQNDRDRVLTEKGINKTKKVAQKIVNLGIAFNYILSSPLARAYQTAEILQKTGLATEFTVCDFFAPDGDINLFLKWLSQQDREELKIALFGHQPDLSNWT